MMGDENDALNPLTSWVPRTSSWRYWGRSAKKPKSYRYDMRNQPYIPEA